MKAPGPPAAAVSLLSAVVGLVFVLQTTPRSVTGVAPSSVTLPPPLALPAVTLPGSVVVTIGRLGSSRRPTVPLSWKGLMLELVSLVARTQ